MYIYIYIHTYTHIHVQLMDVSRETSDVTTKPKVLRLNHIMLVPGGDEEEAAERVGQPLNMVEMLIEMGFREDMPQTGTNWGQH